MTGIIRTNVWQNSLGVVAASLDSAGTVTTNTRLNPSNGLDLPYQMVVRTGGYVVPDGFTNIAYDVLVHSRLMTHTDGINMFFQRAGKYLITTGWRFGSGGDVWTGVRLLDAGTVRGLGFGTGQVVNDPGPCFIQFIADIPSTRLNIAMQMQFIRSGSTMSIATPASASFGYAIVTTVTYVGI
jgi:hypothetical protein